MAHSNRKQPVQSSPGFTRSFRGIPFKEDPNAPPGTLYFLNADTIQFHTINRVKPKWRTKIYDTIRALTRRFKRNKGED